ncbi:uncharacterized protein LAESUDRAFT_693320 [Laetiporus sulphureus 93-53]|uniref:Gti1/Pac2 family-domain-containing protein n=1 Tax=Laetiporus sulphureus 93-53 TaxID=1314785 RepID=A0A165GVW3_9APHY|nr:uncharacterized protein LAESUDRAFT_693320 [Laetiporus sulphureus 93-53]KZT10894.1 hypothetical protein LAESUDRAFT_693320 [Laetiporus sulphureus 93-53]
MTLGDLMDTVQSPTATTIAVHSIRDAQVILYAVYCQRLPKISRRLSVRERQQIHSGSVFVWEERDAFADSSGEGITRWTDGRRWSPSRVRDEFLFYVEQLPDFDADPAMRQEILDSRLIKQTYSAFVNLPVGRRKWHLVAYHTDTTRDTLPQIQFHPILGPLRDNVPEGLFQTARVSKNHARSEPNGQGEQQPDHPQNTPAQLAAPSGSPSTSVTEAPGETVLPYTPDGKNGHSQGSYAQSQLSRRGDDLAPLIYMRASPYPPRHPIDKYALRSLDCRMRIL